MNVMNGRKTYSVAILMALFAGIGWVTGLLEPSTSVEIFLEAAAIAGLRHGVAKVIR